MISIQMTAADWLTLFMAGVVAFAVGMYVVLDGLEHPTKTQVEAAMKGHVLAHAELVGTYEKTGR